MFKITYFNKLGRHREFYDSYETKEIAEEELAIIKSNLPPTKTAIRIRWKVEPV